MSVEDRVRDALRIITAEEPPLDLVPRAMERLPAHRSARRLPYAAAAATALLVVVVAAVAVYALRLGLDYVERPGVAIASPDASLNATATSTAGATTAPPTAAPSPTLAVPLPTLNLQASPSIGVLPTPAAELTDKERSDLYWNAVTDYGPYGFTYDSLAEITRDAHLIVRGRVIDFKPGQIQTFSGTFGGYQTIFGIVAIDEVFQGVPQMRSEGTIEVAELGWPGMSLAELPQHEVILFLKNYAQQREEAGVAPSEDLDDRYYYSRPNGYQCALRNIDGRVDVIVPPGLEEVFAVEFPGGLDGESFDDVAGRIREMVQSSQ